ncbi:LexA-binding, inner membrane-associated putative hydrolase [uncultured archaeon]|nr:LexA-binding, inner membrane-associated putative hydrolase [uncultured archaeon]
MIIIIMMLLEHWIYSLSVAIIAGMVHFKHTGRDYSWIIIASAYAPDLDFIQNIIPNKINLSGLYYTLPIKHGDFHNITFLLIYGFIIAGLLKLFKYKFMDSIIFACIGFGAHLIEDALVYNPAYAFFWPISMQKFDIEMIKYTKDWLGIANTKILFIGIITLVLCIMLRTVIDGVDRIKVMKKSHIRIQ